MHLQCRLKIGGRSIAVGRNIPLLPGERPSDVPVGVAGGSKVGGGPRGPTSHPRFRPAPAADADGVDRSLPRHEQGGAIGPYTAT